MSGLLCTASSAHHRYSPRALIAEYISVHQKKALLTRRNPPEALKLGPEDIHLEPQLALVKADYYRLSSWYFALC
jgi:hypothetical protein